MRRQAQYSAKLINPEYRFDIYMRRVRWLPLFVEQWLVPRFVLEITNKGKEIDRGEIDCEFAAHDEVSSFPVVTTGFKDFKHIQLQGFKKDDTLKSSLKIESRFIKPGRYMIRVVVSKWELAPSDHYELFGVLAKVIPTDNAKGKETVRKMQEIASTPEKERAKTMKRSELIDWRWLEVIKVYDLATLARLMAVIVTGIGIVIGAVVALLRK